MSGLTRCLRSSVGRKGLMGVTGILLSLFLIFHLLGNLLIYAGPDAFNHYAHTIKSSKILLWTARSGLALAFLVHILVAFSLHRENRRARPVRYAREEAQVVSMAARTMLLTGLLILAYLIFHLLHFTLGVIQHGAWARQLPDGSQDVYFMTVRGFQNPVLSTIYLISMVLLYLHLSHALKSFWQSLGWNLAAWKPFFEKLGATIALLLWIGFSSIPVTILLGLVHQS